MTRIVLSFGLCLALCGALASAALDCKEKNGKYASPDQCDAYIECIDGVAEEKLCPDGLLFNQRSEHEGDCTYAPFSSCIEPRTRLQPAQPSDECPRQFGFYRIGDASQCGQYKNCAHGVASLTKCPEGLAFNSDTYQCDWPDQVGDCDAEAFLGFTCPAVVRTEEETAAEFEEVLRYYRKPESCSHYFVCVKDRPRLYSCGKYLAFNEETGLCDFYTKVSECYKNLRDITKIPQVQTITKSLLSQPL
ncbi:protein obstructor-E isoform X2 [Eupeodes corollae]|uniref:protein obstructor-E isoform X2 n=1 Tax=Eupeodes corollae TaxID=290404 RepID=UPI0024931B98|nr:protein obstructor-E isoform X2 [Eupeodes corollae]